MCFSYPPKLGGSARSAGVFPNPPSVHFTEPQFDGAANEYPLHFLPYASQAFLDGSVAHLPWLQELPDVLSTAMWSSWIEINPNAEATVGVLWKCCLIALASASV